MHVVHAPVAIDQSLQIAYDAAAGTAHSTTNSTNTETLTVTEMTKEVTNNKQQDGSTSSNNITAEDSDGTQQGSSVVEVVVKEPESIHPIREHSSNASSTKPP